MPAALAPEILGLTLQGPLSAGRDSASGKRGVRSPDGGSPEPIPPPHVPAWCWGSTAPPASGRSHLAGADSVRSSGALLVAQPSPRAPGHRALPAGMAAGYP